MVQFLVRSNTRLENLKWPYLCNGSSDPLHVWFYGRADRMVQFLVRSNTRLENLKWPYLLNIYPMHFVFGSTGGFLGSEEGAFPGWTKQNRNRYIEENCA